MNNMKTFKTYIRNTTFRLRSYFFISLFLLVSCSSFGQVLSKKNLTKDDYDQWSNIRNKAISPKGSWICFSQFYDKGADTLYVMNTKIDKSIAIPNGLNGDFGNELVFAALQPNNELVLVNLDDLSKSIIAETSNFIFCDFGRVIVTQSVDNSLVIRKKNGSVVEKIANVKEYVYDIKSNSLIYVQQQESSTTLVNLHLKSMTKRNLKFTTAALSALTLSEYGGGIFVTESGKSFGDSILHYFKDSSSTVASFYPKTFPNFPTKYGIVSNLSFRISADGERVFFSIRKEKEKSTSKSDAVEVWDTDDALLYPKAKKDDLEHLSRMICWYPYENRFTIVTDASLSNVQLNGSKTVAIVYNPNAYAPIFKQDGVVDYYLYNLVDNEKKIFLKKQPSELGLISFSPNGNYICYFKEGNWWLYDIVKEEHKNMTADSNTSWMSNDMKYSSRPMVFSLGGWTSDNKILYLQDEYDVYAFKFDSQKLERLTKGREKQIIYTIDSSSYFNRLYKNYYGWEANVVNTVQPLILKSRDQNSKSQYYSLLKKEGQVQTISSMASKSDELLVSAGVYVFREQTYAISPRLVCIRDHKRKILYDTNQQQRNYNWGKVEKISYTAPDGKNLNDLLYYPSNYDSKKKYPMIVFIYSEKSRYFNDYLFPSLYNDIGFNIKNFILKDYFVLTPDIVYDEGAPGISALNCVEASTKSVVATGMIDPKRIGLTGHSFGGYETNFIVTKSTLFACAVAGAGITDLISWGFTVGRANYIAELWRTEYQQWRMGGSFFEYKERYVMNSPLYYAENVTTPLMTWTGRQELNLPFEQNILFFNALRRAGKKNLMIIYPDEGHTIVRKENKIDLTKRIEDWFDFYLQPK
jgi:dipeptidyl aminopeptidase/acylaminoacyl peptidase